MAYYVLLSNFTDQGIKNVKDTQKRADAFKAMASKKWHQGSHVVVDAWSI